MFSDYGIVKGLRRWFGIRTAEDDLVYLLMAGRDDDVIRRQLLEILDQPDFSRQSLLNRWIADLKSESAPAPLIRALAMLVDNDRAERARQIMMSEADEPINT
jgi:hypothetical protein